MLFPRWEKYIYSRFAEASSSSFALFFIRDFGSWQALEVALTLLYKTQVVRTEK